MTNKDALRILIVEDELFIAMDLRDLLNQLGYKNVYHAETLLRAVDLLDTVLPDFAILDVNIGSHVVFPFAAKLLARNIPFIFSTSLTRQMLPEEWQVHHIISKPPERRALYAAIQSLQRSRIGKSSPN